MPGALTSSSNNGTTSFDDPVEFALVHLSSRHYKLREHVLGKWEANGFLSATPELGIFDESFEVLSHV